MRCDLVATGLRAGRIGVIKADRRYLLGNRPAPGPVATMRNAGPTDYSRARLLSRAKVQVTTIRLRIQYCGGCNPEIDRGSLVAHLKQLIESAGLKPILCKDGQPDWLILVNGCARACLEEQFPESQGWPKRISVQGSNFDYRPVAENELPRTIWKIIRQF